MKYIIVIPDGMGDTPLKELKEKTPLEFANTSNMDFIAQNGLVGLIKTIPDGMPAGSDVGNLSALGYNPKKYFFGRASLEAANLEIEIKKDEVVFRCNFVTIDNGSMLDYSAGHISSKEAKSLIESLNVEINIPDIKFYTGKSYRHLLVMKCLDPKVFTQIQCTPPHDILNQNIQEYLPSGEGSQKLLSIMERAQNILKNHQVNKVRVDLKQNPANAIWLWGQGTKPNIPTFKQKFGINGSVISAVDLVNGIGKLARLKIIDVPGATGYYDTNYIGKAQYALDSLKENDFVFIHIEAPDEASHNGDLKMKIACIERIDKEVVGTILNHFNGKDDFRILILPDHKTPVEKRTHTSDPVCFEMFGKGIPKGKHSCFGEQEAQDSDLFFETGEELVDYFIKRYLTSK